MADSATGMSRLPPMLKDEASALDYAARMAYADSTTPPSLEVGVPETIAYDAWYITADSSMPEAGFGLGVRYFVAPNITSGYWRNRGATHIRRFPLPRADQEIRDPDVNYTKPAEAPPASNAPDAMAALKTALLLAVKAVECLERPTPEPDSRSPERRERDEVIASEALRGLPEAPPPEDPDTGPPPEYADDIFDPPLDDAEDPA